MGSPWKTHGSPWKTHGKFIWPNSHGKLMDVSWNISVRDVLLQRQIWSDENAEDTCDAGDVDGVTPERYW